MSAAMAAFFGGVWTLNAVLFTILGTEEGRDRKRGRALVWYVCALASLVIVFRVYVR